VSYTQAKGKFTVRTVDVVREFERWHSILYVYVKDVVILFTLKELFASRTDRIDDLPNFLPLMARTIPLFKSPVKHKPEKW
jgi:hypothetical protein